jgi:hypothetical protein
VANFTKGTVCQKFIGKKKKPKFGFAPRAKTKDTGSSFLEKKSFLFACLFSSSFLMLDMLTKDDIVYISFCIFNTCLARSDYLTAKEDPR